MLGIPQDARALTIPVLPDLHTYASTTAQSYGLDPVLFSRVIECESGFDATATSTTDDYGVAQFNLASHPDITMQEALDPYWSIDEMAKWWGMGRQKSWVCYNRITAD